MSVGDLADFPANGRGCFGLAQFDTFQQTFQAQHFPIFIHAFVNSISE